MKAQLERVLDGAHLSAAETEELVLALARGALPDAFAGAFLAALRAKGETPEELRGMVRAMRRLARTPEVSGDTVDVVGTGGDGSGSLNLSTGAALLAAACGQLVVKHGNRSVSSRSGSADVLEALGVTLPTDEATAEQEFRRTGFTFLFAPTFHPAMKALARVRKDLGVRTVFNLLGPLTNPARPPYGVIGAFSRRAAVLMAGTLAGLEVRRAFVVHGFPGWDEATPAGPFLLLDVRPGSVSTSERDPADYGIPRCGPEDLRGGDAGANAARLNDALNGERGAHRDALVLGAGLALEVAGAVASLADGLARAAGVIDSGEAGRWLDRLREGQRPEAREAGGG